MMIGAHLNAARRCAGWSIAELARRAGMGRPHVSEVLRDLVDPGWSTVRRLAKPLARELGEPLQRLLGGDE